MIVDNIKYEQLEKTILLKIKKETNPLYYYHTVAHTIDVLKSVTQIAEYENISKEEKILLKTASLFHDIGYIKKYNNNEEISIGIAKSTLPDYGYSDSFIEEVCKMIMSTSMDVEPKRYIDKLLNDADLDYLGREDYFDRSMLLYKEWRNIKLEMSLVEWYNIQIDFLSKH